MSVILWLVAFIILIVAEVVTLQLISIWFAAGALVAIVIGLLGGSVMVQFFWIYCSIIFIINFSKANYKKVYAQNGKNQCR